MRRFAVLLAVVTVSVVTMASAAGVDPGKARATNVGGGIAIRVPAGWHLRSGWLSDVIDPVPALAVASFAVRLSRHTCECGMPHVLSFPRTGAFLFMWEYPHLSRRALEQFPLRPVRFRLASDDPVRQSCLGPSDEIAFQDAGRGFQAEIYFGPGAGPSVRARLLAAMDSLRVARRPASAAA